MGKRMLVLGATSDIAQAAIREFIKDGWTFHLAGRDLNCLAVLAQELSSKTHLPTPFSFFDATMPLSQMHAFWSQVIVGNCYGNNMSWYSKNDLAYELQHAIYNGSVSKKFSEIFEKVQQEQEQTNKKQTAGDTTILNGSVEQGIDAIFCAIGYLGMQTKAQCDPLEADLIMRTNFTGLMPILSMAANYFEQKKSGKIIVISSVAGIRGKASNYCYGASKAAMTTFLSGLRIRMQKSGVQVLTILPGYVDTKMIAHRKVPNLITAQPQKVARDIVKAVRKNKDVIYTIWFWRYIMFVVKNIPERIFKRLHKF